MTPDVPLIPWEQVPEGHYVWFHGPDGRWLHGVKHGGVLLGPGNLPYSAKDLPNLTFAPAEQQPGQHADREACNAANRLIVKQGKELTALREGIAGLVKMVGCAHEERSGGNDYLECSDCGLMWDWRKETPQRALFNKLTSLLSGTTPNPVREAAPCYADEIDSPAAKATAHSAEQTNQNHKETPMQDFQQRVVDEKVELDKRLAALVAFSNKAFFATLPKDEQERMNTQRHLMCAYSAVLGARIAAFE